MLSMSNQKMLYEIVRFLANYCELDGPSVQEGFICIGVHIRIN